MGILKTVYTVKLKTVFQLLKTVFLNNHKSSNHLTHTKKVLTLKDFCTGHPSPLAYNIYPSEFP